MVDREYLARLLAGDVSEDVRRWVIAIVYERMTPSERRDERDRWLRAAGALVAGEPWTRARKLHAIALDLGRSPIQAEPNTSTARGCVAAALLLCPNREPPAVHTLYRVLQSFSLA